VLNVLPKSLAKSRTILGEKSSDLLQPPTGRRFSATLSKGSNCSERAKRLLEFAGLLMQLESCSTPTLDVLLSLNLHAPPWQTLRVIARLNSIRRRANAANAAREWKNSYARSRAPNRRWW
jgi:hypothetical protein